MYGEVQSRSIRRKPQDFEFGLPVVLKACNVTTIQCVTKICVGALNPINIQI